MLSAYLSLQRIARLPDLGNKASRRIFLVRFY